MEKVKLPREVAEAITHLKTHHGGNETILTGLLGNANGSCIVTIREYCYSPSVNFDRILSALVNGYEVEETPEDRVKTYYFQLSKEALEKDCDKYSVNHKRHEMTGILTTLNILNIKIEGVNT